MVLMFSVKEEDRRKFMDLKYSFIINGEFSLSNSEILRRLIDSYCETHAGEITPMPEQVYKNYLAKGKRTEKKRAETKKRNARTVRAAAAVAVETAAVETVGVAHTAKSVKKTKTTKKSGAPRKPRTPRKPKAAQE